MLLLVLWLPQSAVLLSWLLVSPLQVIGTSVPHIKMDHTSESTLQYVCCLAASHIVHRDFKQEDWRVVSACIMTGALHWKTSDGHGGYCVDMPGVVQTVYTLLTLFRVCYVAEGLLDLV